MAAGAEMWHNQSKCTSTTKVFTVEYGKTPVLFPISNYCLQNSGFCNGYRNKLENYAETYGALTTTTL